MLASRTAHCALRTEHPLPASGISATLLVRKDAHSQMNSWRPTAPRPRPSALAAPSEADQRAFLFTGGNWRHFPCSHGKKMRTNGPGWRHQRCHWIRIKNCFSAAAAHCRGARTTAAAPPCAALVRSTSVVRPLHDSPTLNSLLLRREAKERLSLALTLRGCFAHGQARSAPTAPMDSSGGRPPSKRAIRFEELQQYFDLPLKEVASRLGKHCAGGRCV